MNEKEVESLYNVTVVDVNTIRYAGKRSARYTKSGLVTGQKNAFKKAKQRAPFCPQF